jgi:CDP-diacylglycerol--glycerol-3-phosphate 3-phosphatidyltransferase
MSKLEKSRKSLANSVTPPFVRLLAKTPLTPDTLTWLGFLINVGAAVLIVTDHFLAAGIVVLVAGLFDLLDGALARHIGKTTRFGAILDSSLDRLSEGAVLLALLVMFAREQQSAGSLVVGVTMLGSIMVSYIRARIEGIGIECKAGIFTRPERVIIMALGLMLNQFHNALLAALAIIAFFSWVTVIERLVYAWRQTRNNNHNHPPDKN